MPPHAVQESRSILVIVVVQLDLWIDHFPNHSLNRKCDCCSYHPPLIYCFLDLLRSYYFASKLLIARGHLFTLKIFRSHHRRNRWPEDAAASCGGSQQLLGQTTWLWEEVTCTCQAFHEKYDEVNGPKCSEIQLSMDKRSARTVRKTHSCKPLPAVVAVAIHRVFAPMALHDAAQVGTLQAFACDHLSLSLV